jgi:hypothetical protein
MGLQQELYGSRFTASPVQGRSEQSTPSLSSQPLFSPLSSQLSQFHSCKETMTYCLTMSLKDRSLSFRHYLPCYNPWVSADMVGPGSVFILLVTCFVEHCILCFTFCFIICFIPCFYYMFTCRSAFYSLPSCCFIQQRLTSYLPCFLHEFSLHVSDIFIKGQTVYKLG